MDHDMTEPKISMVLNAHTGSETFKIDSRLAQKQTCGSRPKV